MYGCYQITTTTIDTVKLTPLEPGLQDKPNDALDENFALLFETLLMKQSSKTFDGPFHYISQLSYSPFVLALVLAMPKSYSSITALMSLSYALHHVVS